MRRRLANGAAPLALLTCCVAQNPSAAAVTEPPRTGHRSGITRSCTTTRHGAGSTRAA